MATDKQMTKRDDEQVLRLSFNDVDASLSVSSFLITEVGRKIDVAISTTNVANDTETYAFSEKGLALYTLTMVYTDGTRDQLLSAERTA